MSRSSTTIELNVRDMVDLENQRDERASIILHGPENVEVVHLSSPQETVVVGREHPSDICIKDPNLSRQHAQFQWTENQLTVTDLDSQNGVWIGENRVKSARLSSGEQVQLGNVTVVAAIKVGPDRPFRTVSKSTPGIENLVVVNPKMQALYRDLERVASHDASVLVLGETGTGKELIAGAIHGLGNRRDMPLVSVNCGAIPDGLLESQLFGHQKGAFTGAISTQPGFFEKAQGGVLFLDEIGEISLSAQAALLRAVETKKISRVGSTTEISVDIKIVTATHCNLEAMVEEGTFRQDLFYRLNIITLELPPLRERTDEIEALTEFFLQRACETWGQFRKRIHPAALEKLKQYNWPGNIRQLRNTIERCVLSCRGDIIGLYDLPEFIIKVDKNLLSAVPSASLSPPTDTKSDLSYKEQLRQWETALISEAMRRANGSKSSAARFLRIPRSTLIGRIEILGLTDTRWV